MRFVVLQIKKFYIIHSLGDFLYYVAAYIRYFYKLPDSDVDLYIFDLYIFKKHVAAFILSSRRCSAKYKLLNNE